MRSRIASWLGAPSTPRTVVTPLATNSCIHCSPITGGASSPGRWPCISAMPGIRNLPAPSTRMTPAGSFARAAGPTATMRPARTTTVWSGSTRGLPSTRTTETPRNAVLPCPTATPGIPSNPAARKTVSSRVPVLRTVPAGPRLPSTMPPGWHEPRGFGTLGPDPCRSPDIPCARSSA